MNPSARRSSGWRLARQSTSRPDLPFLLILALLLLLLPAVFSFGAGKYSDYVWQSDYNPPQKPLNRSLDCQFFLGADADVCAQAEKLPLSSREAVILAAIRKPDPAENHDWVRYWNSQLAFGPYFENAKALDGADDGAWGQNGSLRNAWFRLVHIYPSVYDPKDGAYYVADQALLTIPFQLKFVIPNPPGGEWCSQEYDIKGYDVEVRKSVGDYSTTGSILPVSQLVSPGGSAVLNVSLVAEGTFRYNLTSSQTSINCTQDGCAIVHACVPNASLSQTDTLTLAREFKIKRFPTAMSYENTLSVPKSGFAQGVADISLPSDFLYYQVRVKGYTYTLSHHELKAVRYGQLAPILQLELIDAPNRGGTLGISDIDERDDNITYTARIRYRLPIETADIGQSDCQFRYATPFEEREINRSCSTTQTGSRIRLEIVRTQGGNALLRATVTDRLGNLLEGQQVEFSTGGDSQKRTTDAEGAAEVWIPQRESMQSVDASVVGSNDVSGSRATIFVPGQDISQRGESGLYKGLVAAAPILLIVMLVVGMMTWLWRRRSAWLVLGVALVLCSLAGISWGQEFASSNISSGGGGALDVQATLDACRNYDFDNAVRHFGECSESYRLASEFASMRRTSSVLIANIGPLVVATPDIDPYRVAYTNMVQIALSLFRVAWAFNSLYLILNIFNPIRRNEALKQYIWLIVFVIFVYFSFSLIRESINAVNSISTWVAGTGAAGTLTQATLSAEFVSENYEMLKLILPFLNFTYLVLLARYVTVIGMILFFPFSLLLFFTSATRGFGRAALSVTFAALGLGVLNSILLLIYGILINSADSAISGTFATTFFSASFIVFFGFVNLMVLSIAFLSGVVFIGQARGSEG